MTLAMLVNAVLLIEDWAREAGAYCYGAAGRFGMSSLYGSVAELLLVEACRT